MITITIPMLPPTVNHMYITRKGGGKALTQEVETFRRLVQAEVRRAGAQAFDGPLAFTMRLTYGGRQRADLDNRLKAAQDAMALALHFDDCRIVRIVAERIGIVRGQPQCELTIEALKVIGAVK